jgi:hypothetical protein
MEDPNDEINGSMVIQVLVLLLLIGPVMLGMRLGQRLKRWME